MIPDELVNRLQYIEIYTRKAARHHWVADYRSPIRGRGFEFDQHKPYQQGDDYRQIDWNATARMPQPYIRKAYEEKEMNAVILADLSRSMEFATADQSKRQLLLEVSATLAFSAINDDMKVGLLGFTDEIEIDLPSKKGLAQVWKILETLVGCPPPFAQDEPASAFGLPEYAVADRQPAVLYFGFHRPGRGADLALAAKTRAQARLYSRDP